MKDLWISIKNAGSECDTVEMSRLIIQLFNATGGSDVRFRPLREIVAQREDQLIALAENVDTELIAEIMTSFCKTLFKIRHGEKPIAGCDELFSTLKMAARDVDTELMAQTFERLFFLCECTSPADLREAGIRKIETARQRVVTAVRDSGWGEIAHSLSEMLWALSDVRPDFEALPAWIADAASSGVFESLEDSGAGVTEKVFTLLRSTVNQYGTDVDRDSVSRMKSMFLGGREGVQSDELAVFSADIAVHLAQARLGCRRLPLAVDDDELVFGRHTRVSFHRTLRVPEDGQKYPLPAGFGRLPILRVEDYAERVPAKWLEQGGFIIPLYQREALFLEFSGVKWRPTIGKVSIGRINAITGKEHDLKLRPHRQDYVVIPEQRWLDGINSGNGLVSQFVAMPLGQGYTVEAQMTDEEVHGGFQISVFDPRRGRFPEHDPEKAIAASDARKARRFRAEQVRLLKSMPPFPRKVIQALQKEPLEDAAMRFEMSVEDICAIIQTVRNHFENLLGEGGFEGVIPASDNILYAHVPTVRRPSDMEMGIAAGGSIEQQILEDTYGVESWDETAYRDIVIHIVNSKMYEQITGLEAPETPISVEDYQRYGIPWFSDYQEEVPALAPTAAFKHVRSIGQIDQNRGIKDVNGLPISPIQPEVILRIQTPKLQERFDALVERAKCSVQNERFEIAIREASLALDLSQSQSSFAGDRFTLFLIRAHSHLSLGNEADAESDASDCLDLDPTHIQALTIRALASLGIGEYLLAKVDAEKVLKSVPDAEDALRVRKHAILELARNTPPIQPREQIRQVVIPQDKIEGILNAARGLIKEGVNSPEGVALCTLELSEHTGRDLRKYAQAIWNCFGMVDTNFCCTPDWNEIFTRLKTKAKLAAKPASPLL